MTVYHGWAAFGLGILSAVVGVAMYVGRIRALSEAAQSVADGASTDVAACNRKISTHDRQIGELTRVLAEFRRDFHYMGKSHEELKLELRDQREALDHRMKEMSEKLDRLFEKGCAIRTRCA